nr:sushi, HYR, ephrin receptor-like, and EGF domain-containing protein [Crepidula fornicata]
MNAVFTVILACAAIIGCTQGMESEEVWDSEHVDCSSKDDDRLKYTCELDLTQRANYQCMVTPGVRCQGKLYVGPGSICEHEYNDARYRCTKGQWRLVSNGNEDDESKPNERVKRWGWRSPIRIRLRRTVCNIGRWFRRTRCSSGGGGGGPPANRPPTFTSCPVVSAKTADSGRLDTVVTWSPPTATDPDGETPSVTLTGGQASGSKFREGGSVTTFKARDPRGLDAYCIISINVNVITCSGYQMLQHGNQVCSGARHNIYGSKCTHSCFQGYELNGARDVTCQRSGQWDASFPTCQPVSCGAPPSVSDGDLVCPGGHNYPSICLIQCKPGYTHSGTTYIQCNDNKAWSPGEPCIDAEAPEFTNGCPANQQLYSGPLESPVNVTWTEPDVTDNSNGTVSVTSSHAQGSSLGPGFHIIRLTATDPSGNTAHCVFVVAVQVRRCSAFISPSNSLVTCTRGYVEGSTCSVACNTGYQLQGNASLQCLGSQLWDSSPPVCDVISCPTPSAVPHGTWVCSGPLQFQSVCTLTCDQGFKVQGSLLIQCQGNRSWTSPGHCRDSEPPEFINTPCHDNVEVYASSLGQPTFANFTDPPVSDNSGGQVTLTSDLTSGDSFPVGVTTVTLTATDADGNNRTCQFSVTVTSSTCGAPDLELANRSRTIMTYECLDGYVYGASCTLGCSYGFPLVGASNITCESDVTTYPPTMTWTWPDPHLGKPECRENECPTLPAPTNGALACFLGSFGWDCLMSCHASWDVPASTDGHSYCTNSNKFWVPSSLPNCVVRVRPGQVHLLTDVFYFTGSCNTSLDSLKQSFIDRLSNSTFKDACVGVPSCVWQNVQVTCGPNTGRRKRAAPMWDDLQHSFSRTVHEASRVKRQTHYVTIEFEIVLDYVEDSLTPKEAYTKYMNIFNNIHQKLQNDTDAGLFNIHGMTTTRYDVGYPRAAVNCPPGYLWISTASTTNFNCVGCSQGHYLGVNSTQCAECPVGQYTELDNATSCTACPAGWSTPSSGSKNISQCQELCTPGSVSRTGFVPCQKCPPGHFSDQDGAKLCLPCPAGTWTGSGTATGLHDCTHTDIRVSSNHSVSATVSSPWSSASSLSVQTWLHLDLIHSCLLHLSFGSLPSPPSLSLLLYTDGVDTSSLSVANASAELHRVESGVWTHVLFNLQPQDPDGDLHLYVHGSIVQNYTLAISSNDAVTLRISTDNDTGVIVSGLRAQAHALSQGEITEALKSCMGNNSENLMSWTPYSTSLFLPSTCDAVNECLSSPCGSHGVCKNLQTGFQCQCGDGWSGATCQTPPGVCYQHPCQNGASCTPGTSNFTCVCPADYGGDLCQFLKVHGGYGEWASWTTCSATCGGTQQRERECNNPAPQYGGDNCTESHVQTAVCTGSCPVDGGWGAWQPYSSCSASCEGGEKVRHRTCDNPLPLNNGSNCSGPSTEKDACNTEDCPIDGGWGKWVLGDCSVTCGTGSALKQRSCNQPVPANGGQDCSGAANVTVACNTGPCPTCSTLTRSSGAILTCQEEWSPGYLKTCNLTCLPGYVSSFTFPLYQCGEITAYVWSHQRDRENSDAPLPSCSRPSTLSSVVIRQAVLLNTQCQSGQDSAVKQGLETNLDSNLPCSIQGMCSVAVSTDCHDSSEDRRRRSVDPLLAIVELNLNFGSSQVIDINDTAAVATYEQQLRVADDSFVMMTETSSTTLFTVTVGGTVISPLNISYDTVGLCASGYTAVEEYCVECPAGSKEDNGQCVLCPMGQYQDQTAAVNCKPCPPGLTWDVVGATLASQCIFPYNDTVSQPAHPNKSSGGDDNDIAMIVGAVVGAVAMVIIIVVIIFLIKRHIQQQKMLGSQWSLLPERRVSPTPTSVPPLQHRTHSLMSQTSLFSATQHGRATPSDIEVIPHEKYLPPIEGAIQLNDLPSTKEKLPPLPPPSPCWQ